MSGPRSPDPATRLDPRDAGERLHRAAELLRSTNARRARGPWRWADPDPEAGAAVLLDRPTSPKDLRFPPRATGRPDPREPVAEGRVGGAAGGPTVDPVLCGPLAELLDALGLQVALVVDDGGSLHDEPYRSALRLAGAVLGGPGGSRPGSGR